MKLIITPTFELDSYLSFYVDDLLNRDNYPHGSVSVWVKNKIDAISNRLGNVDPKYVPFVFKLGKLLCDVYNLPHVIENLTYSDFKIVSGKLVADFSCKRINLLTRNPNRLIENPPKDDYLQWVTHLSSLESVCGVEVAVDLPVDGKDIILPELTSNEVTYKDNIEQSIPGISREDVRWLCNKSAELYREIDDGRVNNYRVCEHVNGDKTQAYIDVKNKGRYNCVERSYTNPNTGNTYWVGFNFGR